MSELTKERQDKINAFLKEIAEVCNKHGLDLVPQFGIKDLVPKETKVSDPEMGEVIKGKSDARRATEEALKSDANVTLDQVISN